MCSTASILVQVLSVSPLITACCSLTAFVHQALVIALSRVHSGSVCSLSGRFESRKPTTFRSRIISLCKSR